MYVADLLLVSVFVAMIHFDKWQAGKAKCPDHCSADHKCNKEIDESTRDS